VRIGGRDVARASNKEALMRHLMSAVCAASLLALAASPAVAASLHHKRHHGRVVTPGQSPSADGRYYGHPYNAGTVTSGGPIYRDGYYLGSDPDPNVRFEMIRDPWFARGRD
jgi:hypothetical protein